MRAFIIVTLFFLVFLLFASKILGNVDLASNAATAASAAAAAPAVGAAAPISSQPLVITIQEAPATTTSVDTSIPVTGSCTNPYIVRPGDWLSKIAIWCNISLDAILQANPQIINPDLIFPNQYITMPNSSTSVAIPVPVTGLAETIQSGSTLQVRAIQFPPNTPVNVTIGPNGAVSSAVTSGITDASGALSTQITVPNPQNSPSLWTVTVSTTSNMPIQAISQPFYIK
jgi:LysM repeat protein